MGFASQDFTRDRWGRPLITPAKGGKPVAYTRISGYGSVLENQFGLTKWKLRTLLKGSLDRPDLRASAEARLHDDRHLDEIVDMMMEHAGASSAANIGTAIHDILAQLDSGEIRLESVPAQFRPYADGWQAALATHGYEVVPDLVERHLVNDRFKAAGSGDNFVRRISDGKLVALDKKTGKQIAKRPIAYMVQLYLYATAELYDVETGTRTPLDNVDRTQAIIAHLPAAGDGTCTLYSVNLHQTQEIAVLAQAVKIAEKEAPEVVAFGSPAPKETSRVDQPASDERVEWVKDKLRACLGYSDASATMTSNVWPSGIPGFKTDHRHTHRELNEIVTALEAVEKTFRLPFGPNDPEPLPTRLHAIDLVKEAFPSASVSDTSELMPADEIAEMREMFNLQPPEVRHLVGIITAEAKAANRSLSLDQHPSRKRYAAAKALLACAQFEEYDAVRAIVEHTLGATPDTLGQIFGDLDISDAEAIENTANAIGIGTLSFTFDKAGSMTVAKPKTTKKPKETKKP